jgi:hypothetical protein
MHKGSVAPRIEIFAYLGVRSVINPREALLSTLIKKDQTRSPADQRGYRT